jgi:hypothetical protein
MKRGTLRRTSKAEREKLTEGWKKYIKMSSMETQGSESVDTSHCLTRILK